MNQYSFMQFNDLPQIPDDQHLGHWSSHHEHFVHPHHIRFPDRPLIKYEDNMDSFNSAQNQGISMQRFLHGADPIPFVSGMHRPNLDRLLPVPGVGIYEPPWPTSDCHLYPSRDGSPGRTSVSGTSTQDTCNELRSPHPYHRIPYGSPSDHYHPAMSYPSPQHSQDGVFAPEFPLPGGICPRDVELEHVDAEHNIEDQDIEHIDTKGGFEYPHDQTQYYANHTQADMEQDDCDSKDYALSTQVQFHMEESVQPAAPSSEDSDPDYEPKKRNNSTSSGSGRPKRTSRGRKNSAVSPSAIPTRVAKRSQRGSNASQNPTKSPVTKSPVTKSPVTKSPVTKSPKSPTTASSSLHAETHRYFPCSLAIYGCSSTFTSKNEWKRHMSTQHIKLGYWRCDLCTTAIDPNDADTVYHNDFNRKDLYTQHLRRMHADPKIHAATGANSWRHTHTGSQTPNKASSSASASTSNSPSPSIPALPVTDENIPTHQARCYKMLRQTPPRSSCIFCDVHFSGPNSWDERMEHVGRHLEKERKPEMLNSKLWREDLELENWLVDEGLIAWSTIENAWRIGNGKPRRDSILEESGMEE